MNIEFQHILPLPLAEDNLNDQSIWKASFTLKKGEKIMLNAISGKGKTTFTEILAGIRTDFTGSLLLDNQNAKEFGIEKWAQLRREQLSFVFQDLQLFPTLTVEKNLQVKNQLTGVFNEDELRSMLEALNIGEKWQAKCNTLSMGQQQRVAIIRALCQPFDWIILDEPFSHLDVENTNDALQLILQRANKLGAGVVLTTLGGDLNYPFDRELTL